MLSIYAFYGHLKGDRVCFFSGLAGQDCIFNHLTDIKWHYVESIYIVH